MDCSSAELNSTTFAQLGKFDPTDQPLSEVIRILKFMLCECIGEGKKQADIPIDKPLQFMGLDSAQSIQLQVYLTSLVRQKAEIYSVELL